MTDDNTDGDELDDQPDYCPHCNGFDTIEEKGKNETPICTICYTTPDGDVLAQIDVKTETDVDFGKQPHRQSLRPRYAGAVKHGRDKQVVLYGAFPWDPILAPLEQIQSHSTV